MKVKMEKHENEKNEIDETKLNFWLIFGELPNVINSFRSESISVKMSTHSSIVAAVICLSKLYSAVRVKRPAPLPQLSYILDTYCISSMVGELCLIRYKAHSKYSRKSIVPHISCK